MEKDNKSSGFAVFIILIGICVLLLNFDILKVNMFWGIAHLWPLMLIIAGLTILFRRVRYFNVVLWLIFFGIVIGYSYLNMDEKSWFFGEQVEMIYQEEDVLTVTEGVLELDMSHGSLVIGTNEDNKISYNVPNVNIREKTLNTSTTEPTALIIKDSEWDDFLGAFQNRKYEFSLPTQGVWDIDLDGAVIDGDINLSEIDVATFRLDYAVGDMNIYIGDYSTGSYNIDLAIGDIMIDIPNDMPVKMIIDGGLKSISVPDGFTQDDTKYYSEDFDESEDYILIKVDLAIGNVEIK